MSYTHLGDFIFFPSRWHSLGSIWLHIKTHTWLNVLNWAYKVNLCFIVEEWILLIGEWFHIICSWLNRTSHLSKFALFTHLLVGDISLYHFHYFSISYTHVQRVPLYTFIVLWYFQWSLSHKLSMWLSQLSIIQAGAKKQIKKTKRL